MDKNILQGIWKLEEAFGFEHGSQKYNKTDLGSSFNYFEFKDGQFCIGDLDKNGAFVSNSKPAQFVVEGDVLLLNSEPFKKASWKWEVKRGKLELIAIKPNGDKAKYVFSGYTNTFWSKLKNRLGLKLTWSRALFYLVIIWAVWNIITAFTGLTVVSVYYIKPEVANVRECESVDCEIIGEIYRNAELTFPYESLEDMPEWLEINLQDEDTGEEQSGYINKVVLSDEMIF